MNEELKEIIKTKSLDVICNIEHFDEKERENDFGILPEHLEIVGKVVKIDEWSTHKGYESMSLYYLPKHDVLIRCCYGNGEVYNIEEVQRIGEYGVIEYKSTIK